MVVANGGNPLDYCAPFARRDPVSGEIGTSTTYCYPEYYRTMAMRLYLYAGRAATPPGPIAVVAFRQEARDGQPFNLITADWTFPTYEDARRFVEASGRTDVRIVSTQPSVTCVPLEAVHGYHQVFRSLGQESGPASPHVVQVFEYRAPTGKGL